MIPNRIFYTWFGGAPLPQTVRENIETWRKFQPGFDIIEINESNFDVSGYRFSQAAYDAKAWAFVSDVARIHIVNQNGGIYFDTDVKLIRPLTADILGADSFWGLENSNMINPGLGFGSSAGNVHLGKILAVYNEIDYVRGQEHTFSIPRLVTSHFKDAGLHFRNKNQVLEDGTLILKTAYLAPYHYWGGGRITKDTIAVHQYDASWTALNFTKKQKLNFWIKYYLPWIYDLKLRFLG